MSGGFAAPAENLDSTKIKQPRELGYEEFLDFDEADSLLLSEIILSDEDEYGYALPASGKLVPEEQDLARALVEIADKYGKFNEDQTGIWADYHEPEDNPYAEMGVKCGNCVLYRGGQECAIVAFKVDPEGYCRFAVLPDGTVDPSKAPEGTKPFEQHELAPIVSDADYGGKCPPATQDIVLNIENRQNAIDNVGYGPLNPAEPNEEFWQDKADRWNIESVEAKKSICGNCVFFDRRPKTLDCIESGIAEGGSGEQSAWDAIDQAELGYCTALDFKCAASRTCNAWAAGGPVTEDSVTATAGSKPAPKKDQIKGSSKNKKGSAAGNKKVTFSKKVEKSLQEKADKHNEKYGDTASKKTSLKTLKAVYRRGAGAFSTSHRPDQNRNSWAMARVNAFLHLLRTGAPKNSNYTTDNDLLPPTHRRSSKSSASITAGAAVDYDSYVDSQLDVSVLSKEDYASNEHAIYSMAEYSGFGYEIIPSLKASWLRAEKAGEDSFERALELAVNLYESPDSDLLPRMEN